MNTSQPTTTQETNNDEYKNFFKGNSSLSSGNEKSNDGYRNVFLHGLGSAFDSYSNLLTFNYLNVTNDILKIIHDQMNIIVPSGDEVADAKRLQESILLKIGTLAKTPEFQEKWKELTKSLAELLNETITQVIDIIDQEGDDVINRVGKVANRMIVNLTATAVDTVEDALSVVPGLDAILAVFTLFTSAITNGANSMLTALTLFNSMIELVGKMSGTAVGVDEKLVNISTQMQDFIKMLQSPGKEINSMLDNVDKFNKIPDITPKTQQMDINPYGIPTISQPTPNKSETTNTPQKKTQKNIQSLTKGGMRNKRTRKRKQR